MITDVEDEKMMDEMHDEIGGDQDDDDLDDDDNEISP